MKYQDLGYTWIACIKVGTILNIISNNPYRILGVYANSSKKDILSNKGKAIAFLKVNKSVEYPLDLNGILPFINRTIELFNEAESSLSLPQEQIKFAQFWFIKKTHLDDIAFNHLIAGNMQMALDLWTKQDNVTSLQNRIVCHLINNEKELALHEAEILYMKFGADYICAIDPNSTVQKTNMELLYQFLDSIINEIDTRTLLELSLYTETRRYLIDKYIDILVNTIYVEIDKAKRVDHKDSDARLKAARVLVKNTRQKIKDLKTLVSSNDSKYQLLADKLGLTILQCGIDYYNDSKDDDAAFIALKIQKYAQTIVVGKMAKDRCDENVRILEEIISKLPPQEVMPNHRAIQISLAAFAIQPNLISYSILLIKECAPHLVEIKEKLGDTHEYYIKTSTTIVNKALGNVISEVNKAQNADFNALKATLISAWRAQLYMDKFDLDPEYKEGRYKECREALHRIISNCKGFESPLLSYKYQYGCGWCNNLDVSDVDLRTEEEYYQSCNNLSSYRYYLKRFPSGKYATQAKSKIVELSFKECKTITDFQKFISDFPNSGLVPKAQEELYRIKKEDDERRARIERQERSISSCRTTDEVVSLYNREKNNKIDVEKCSLRAFELAKCEEDYRKVTSTFTVSTLGGKKAKTKLDEIEKIRKKAAELKKKNIKWSLIIIIPLLILVCIYLIWGIGGLSSTCYVFTFIFGLIAFGGIGSKESEGCLIGIISGAIAFGLGNLGGYLEDLSKEEKKQKTEYATSLFKNTNNYSRSNNSSSSTTDDTKDEESYNVDTDYETYINNQLKTGSKPYKDYYRSRTGDNYLDFKTSGKDYVIIVRDYSSSEVVNHVYIRAGDKGRLYLPNGTYNIYFYGGKGWNPNMENGNVTGGFVSGGHIQKDGPVELYNQYGEYTLYPVQNGNLQLQGASIGEAF